MMDEADKEVQSITFHECIRTHCKIIEHVLLIRANVIDRTVLGPETGFQGPVTDKPVGPPSD